MFDLFKYETIFSKPYSKESEYEKIKKESKKEIKNKLLTKNLIEKIITKVTSDQYILKRLKRLLKGRGNLLKFLKNIYLKDEEEKN